MTPLAPFSIKEQQDTLIRLPIWKILTRPRFLNSKNKKDKEILDNISFKI